MDGYQFEEQCAIILKRKHFSKIEVTKSSGDQGVDIIAYKHRKKYGIQCKYYTVIVMTNTTFTRSAIELAEKLDVELWPDCPVTPFYSLLFKIMGLLNLLLFLYAILTLFSAKYDFIHLPVSLDTISLVALLTASALGIFGWKYLLCNLITAGAFLFLAFHVVLSPVSLATDYTHTQLLSLIPAVVYMLHAGRLKLKKMKK